MTNVKIGMAIIEIVSIQALRQPIVSRIRIGNVSTVFNLIMLRIRVDATVFPFLVDIPLRDKSPRIHIDNKLNKTGIANSVWAHDTGLR